MGIMEVISRSLKEMFLPERFLPFFLLYLIFSFASLIFIMSMLSRLPALLASPSALEVNIYYANSIALLITLIVVSLVNIWFSGALVWSVRSRKKFEKCLEDSKKIYLQMFAYCLVILVLFLITFLFREFSFILQILIDWIFIFAFPAIVIKKDSFDFALGRSFNLVKKKVFQTFSFWALTRFILLIIFIVFLFFSTAILLPIFKEVRSLLFSKAEVSEMTRMASLILANYHLLFIEAILASFFFSIMYVFNLISKTYYFMEISKAK